MVSNGDDIALDFKTRCVYCPAGYYQNEIGREDLSLCKAASAGKYVDKVESKTLSSCPKGTYSKLAASLCTDCPAGFYQPKFSGTDCSPSTTGWYVSEKRQSKQLPCPVGKYGQNDGIDCDSCPLGWFQKIPALMKCNVADPGHFVPIVASATQIKCPAGWYGESMLSRSICLDCPTGKYSEIRGLTVEQQCTLCASGKYGDETALPKYDRCKLCPRGYFGDSPGLRELASCKDCNSGQKQPDNGKSICIKCSSGQYQPNITATQCLDCDVGRYQTYEGSSICSDCQRGYFQAMVAGTKCDLCEAGYFQPLSRATNCTFCPLGFYSECKGRNDCLKCEAGQTTYPRDKGTRCRAKQLATVQPVFHQDTGINVSKLGGFTRICLEWIVPPTPNENLLPRNFEETWLQWSATTAFSDKETNTTILAGNATRGCVIVGSPAHINLVYFRVRGKIGDALGTPSQVTPRYETAPSCGEVMYLCVTCRPPKGRGVWSVGVGGYNANPREWKCLPCPPGADCRGAKIWDGVYAKYGNVRLGDEDYQDRKDSFWPCFKHSACLGGKIGPFDGETRATKHGFFAGE